MALPASSHPSAAPAGRAGLWLGLLGVALFALTVPMTRLAVGAATSPQLPPTFVTIGRAAVAGLLSLLWLRAVGAPWPARRLWPAIALCAAGTVLGFPLGLALALREVPAMHAAVVTGILPLATAVAAAIALRQRASFGFWCCACLGAALVAGFAAHEGGGRLQAADGWLALAVLSAATGYVAGARVSAELPATQTICWVLVLSLPWTLPAAAWHWPSQPAALSAWLGFAYVSLFSMWIGFFAWYRALALGGVMRVSQVQLIQPFLSLLFAVPLLGEPLTAGTVVVALAVAATVAASRRMAVAPAPAVAPASTPAPPPAPPPASTPATPRPERAP